MERFAIFLLILTSSTMAAADERAALVVVVGAGGEAEYAEQFADWAERWRAAADKAATETSVIGRDADSPNVADASKDGVLSGSTASTDHDRLRDALAALSADSAAPVWLVLIGHGTYDGREAKFNLRGPDVAADELAAWLAAVERPLAVIDCASSSAPFINHLSREGRVIVTATKSGYEQNYARFGQYMAAAVDDLAADLDKDGQTSLLEAFITASRQTADFYKAEGRLATESALIDDNGDAHGTPAAWFRGVRAVQKAEGGQSLDGVRAHQLHLVPSDRERQLPAAVRQRRDELELAIARLRESKSQLDESAYYHRLEPLAIELAELYESVEAEPRDLPPIVAP